ncbi:pentapeptide repeat-containing protein [Streptomyces bullii]|uniref:Pentapeptide repeat-containing protein n=1 Tax=Streptomyces bullii TaxID=349910 RepID=A0ABW0V114_9ACTN
MVFEGTVDFSEATFSGGRIYLTGARFTGGIVDFSQATGSAPAGLLPPSGHPRPAGLIPSPTW